MKSSLLPDTHIYYDVVINTLSHLINANQDIKELEKIQWKVAVIDKPAVNASVLPVCIFKVALFLKHFQINFVDGFVV